MMAAKSFDRSDSILACLVVGLILVASVADDSCAQQESAADSKFDDHRNMMDQLGIQSLRPGANPNDPDTYDEENAKRFLGSMPDALTMNDGTAVTRPDQWPPRRAEIVELFEREVYGRIPTNVPKVTWEVVQSTDGEQNGIPTVTKRLLGRVDNTGYPQITVNI